MIYDPIDQSYRIIVLSKQDDNDPFTSDTVFFNETYRLSYKIDGYPTPVEYSTKGSEMIRRASQLLGLMRGSPLHELRNQLGQVVTLWATRKTDYALYASMKSKYHPEAVQVVEDALSARRKKVDFLQAVISTYLYLQLCGRNTSEKCAQKNIVCILDKKYTQEELSAFEDRWMEQPIVTRLNLKSFDELKQLLDNDGVRVIEFRSEDKVAA